MFRPAESSTGGYTIPCPIRIPTTEIERGASRNPSLTLCVASEERGLNMSKRASGPARVIAATALVCGVAVLVVVIASSLDGNGGSGRRVENGQVRRAEKKGSKGSLKGSYIVQNGDTLSSISQETGVPVSQILKLNPGVDPQILISGEKLKLR
jgi:LysM repeat protein